MQKSTKKKKKLNPRATVREFGQIPQSDVTFTSAVASTSQISSRTIPLNSERPLKRQRTDDINHQVQVTSDAIAFDLPDAKQPDPVVDEDPIPQGQKQVRFSCLNYTVD